HSDLESAVSAFQGGAFEYLPKPFDISEAIDLVRRAIKENPAETSPKPELAAAPEILGQAPAMQEIFKAIGKLSHSNVTVLITGESGTGKELVARALHRHSLRSKRPFIALNMAAIPRDLLESELFGHERGAFTGAQVLRRGRFEQAEGGTLFLDEIGDMPLDLQTRLLRVLSDGHFYRVGGSQSIRADVRVIAATHQDLEQQVREGRFREDLFHRLNVIRLRLPNLSERKEDIPVLARHFLAQSARQLGAEAKRLSEEALSFLLQCDFQGNVRQLENLCHWFMAMVPGQVIGIRDIPRDLLQKGLIRRGEAFPDTTETIQPHSSGWDAQLEKDVSEALTSGEKGLMAVFSRRFETVMIQSALRHTGGRKNEAAKLLGIGRNTITRKIQELDIIETGNSQTG
ncbi:nitrogen regulation protein NR(I), partial [Oxalobacter sp. OttesenSCG-928-P03]|nr:nitrogen regulation protein NR(I) [Oxalobacter sp. OttesenSCG-928-P03]